MKRKKRKTTIVVYARARVRATMVCLTMKKKSSIIATT